VWITSPFCGQPYFSRLILFPFMVVWEYYSIKVKTETTFSLET
jgi:hypothetical protein